MAALTNDDLSISGLINYDNKTLQTKDLLDYTLFGLVAANVVACYTAVQDQTIDTFHDNTNFAVPDAVLGTSPLSTPPVDFPVDNVSGLMLTGDFTVTYRVRAAIPSIPIADVNGAPANTFVVPMVLFGDYVPVVGQMIVTTGNANGANNGTFVITGVEDDGSQYSLQVANALVTESGTPGAELLIYFTFEKEFTFNLGSFEKPVVTQENTYSCVNGTLSATDKTPIGNPSSSTLVHTVAYPQALGDQQPADIVSSAITILVGPPIYTFTWVITVQWTLEYTYDDGLIITTVTEGAEELPVVCFNLCCLVESLGLLKDKMNAQLNAANVSMYTTDYLKAVGLLVLIRENAERCDDAATAKTYYDELVNILKKYSCLCEDCAECSGTSNMPVPINPSYLTVIGASAVSLSPITGLDATNVQAAIAAIFAAQQFTLKAGLPGLTDDITKGVVVSAIKMDTTSGILYKCTSNAAGAATWDVYYDPNATITLPYIDYVGRLTSSGVLISETEVLNDFGAAIVWARTGVGTYTGTLAGAFANGLTEVLVKNNRTSEPSFMSGIRANDNTVLVTTFDENGAASDGLLNETFVEIRKYAA